MLSARILSRLGVAKNRNWGLPKSRNAERETGAKPAVFSRCGMVLNQVQHDVIPAELNSFARVYVPMRRCEGPNVASGLAEGTD